MHRECVGADYLVPWIFSCLVKSSAIYISFLAHTLFLAGVHVLSRLISIFYFHNTRNFLVGILHSSIFLFRVYEYSFVPFF